MNAITAAMNAQIQTELQQDLFIQFVEYVDRSEKTTRTYLTNLRQFAKWLQAAGITQPTRADVLHYRDDLAQTRKPNTVKQYLQSVRQFFAWTSAAGYYPNIAANIHAPKVKQDTHRKRALTADNVLTIENSITSAATRRIQTAATSSKDTAGRVDRATEQGKRLHAMYLLAVTAGLRTIEISRANVEHVKVIDGQPYICIHGKGHEEADTNKPIAPQVYDAIRNYLNARTDKPTKKSPLFVATGNRSGGKRLAATTISTMLKRAMQQAGFDDESITAHSLRHTAGTNVMELTGDNLYKTQQYMRHANPATTEIYLHRQTERQEAEIAERLYKKYHGEDTDQDARAEIEKLLQSMTADQVKQLAGVAQAIAK